MDKENKSLLEKIELWFLLGPFILLLTLTILLFNPLHLNILTPLMALIGLPVCWKWGLRGLWIAQGFLGSILAYQIFNVSEEQLFSELLLGAATALTLTITSLCRLEVKELMDNAEQAFSVEAQKHQEINEKISVLHREKEQMLVKEALVVESLQQQLYQKEQLLKESEEAIEQMRTKTHAVAAQNESLLRELFQKRHEYEKLFLQLQSAQDIAKAAEAKLEVAVMAKQEAEEKLVAEIAKQAEEEKEEELVLACAAPIAKKEQTLSKKENAQVKPTSKGKNKSSKTNNWANTILSRWSESDDQP